MVCHIMATWCFYCRQASITATTERSDYALSRTSDLTHQSHQYSESTQTMEKTAEALGKDIQRLQ